MGRSGKQAAKAIRKKVEAIDKVKSIRSVNVRLMGRKPQVDMTIELENGLGFEDVHKIVSRVEEETKSVLPDARVRLQTRSHGLDLGDVWKTVKDVAEKVPGTRDVHNIHVQDIDGKLCVDLHLEVSANMTVKQAHGVASQVEEKLKKARPEISEITVHLESASDIVSREMGQNLNELKLSIEHIMKHFPEVRETHGVRIRNVDGDLHMVLRCRFDPNLGMGEAHEITKKIENAIRSEHPNIQRIDIHEEPA